MPNCCDTDDGVCRRRLVTVDCGQADGVQFERVDRHRGVVCYRRVDVGVGHRLPLLHEETTGSPEDPTQLRQPPFASDTAR